MRKWFYAFTVAILFVVPVTAMAAENDAIPIYINGQEVQPEVAPILQNNRVMVPIRYIAESFAAQVDWRDPDIFVQKDDLTLQLTVNSPIALRNGVETLQLDGVPFVQDNRTMVPLRFLAEGLGLAVDYQDGKVFIVGERQPQNLEVTSFDDVAQLNLYNGGYLAQERDGSIYWVKQSALGQIKNNGKIVTGSLQVYYPNSQTGQTVLESPAISNINIVNQIMYFSDGKTIKSMDFNTSIKKPVTIVTADSAIDQLYATEDFLYYTTADQQLFTCDLRLGQNIIKKMGIKADEFVVIDDMMYVIQDGILYEYALLYNKLTPFHDNQKVSDLGINGNYLYFLNEQNALCRIKTDGSKDSIVVASPVYSYTVYRNQIWFSEGQKIDGQWIPGNLYQMTMNTPVPYKIASGCFTNLQMLNGQLYYYERSYQGNYDNFVSELKRYDISKPTPYLFHGNEEKEMAADWQKENVFSFIEAEGIVKDFLYQPLQKIASSSLKADSTQDAIVTMESLQNFLSAGVLDSAEWRVFLRELSYGKHDPAFGIISLQSEENRIDGVFYANLDPALGFRPMVFKAQLTKQPANWLASFDAEGVLGIDFQEQYEDGGWKITAIREAKAYFRAEELQKADNDLYQQMVKMLTIQQNPKAYPWFVK